VAERDRWVEDLAGAILDGASIDWQSEESSAGGVDRPLLTQLRLLAIVADYVSEALSDAAGRRVHASSIDNTLRLGPIEPSEWLRCDIAIEAVHAGVGHGRMRIHSQSGLLMALASTSLILREPRSPAAQAT